ncbi:SH3 domain-containing protein [Kurthia massiliensis]|uniref:SH3 domain-containing protein n=1 Tax=Kurthia massiliensis TaxID=1033739 RepID=UPI000289325D|nr:SH3 domain-containing protein [Kurthia massiliensis]
MKKTALAFLIGASFLLGNAQTDEAAAKTHYLKLKALETTTIYQKPSASSKVVGTLKKGKSVKMTYLNHQKSYYKVTYKGKPAYIRYNYETLKSVAPTNKWIGDYYDRMTAGSGGITNLYVYKQTSKKFYYVATDSYREGSGVNASMHHKTYKGSARILSSTTARIQVNSCTGYLKRSSKTLKPTSNSDQCWGNRAYSTVMGDDRLFQK